MKTKILGKLFLEFFLSIFLFFTIVTGLLTYTLSKRNLLNQMEKEQYVKQLTIQIEEEMKNYIGSSGLEEKVLNEILKEEDIEKEIKKKIDSLENDVNLVVDTTFIKEKLQQNISLFLEEKNLTAEEETIKKFINQIANVYEEELKLYNYQDILLKGIRMLRKSLKIAFLVLSILTIISYVSLVLLTKEKKISQHLFANFVFLEFLLLYINTTIDIKHIMIITPLFSNLLKSIIESFLSNVQIISIVSMCLALITISFRKRVK